MAVSWLIGPFYLAVAAAGLLFVFGNEGRLMGWTLGALLVVLVLWITISIFYPSAVDRHCPACAQDLLEPLDPMTTRGLRCAGCGYVDETASSFYHAEESGALSAIVRRETIRREAASPDRPTPPGAGGVSARTHKDPP